MPAFSITGLAGQKSLAGTIPVYGAKNFVLPAMAAALILPGETVLEQVPEISDVAVMSDILRELGATLQTADGVLKISAPRLASNIGASAKSLRASVLLIGPVLARTGTVTIPHPGGDLIGERPIDLFAQGFERLGAHVSEDGDRYTFSAPHGLSGGEFFFSTVSVTATETLLIAATLAKGTVVLVNAAMEPEIVALADMLRAAGARIEGDGTPVITVRPVSLVSPPPTTIIPDRIEAATFLALGALAAESLTIQNVRPDHLAAVLDVCERMGVPLSIGTDSITVRAPERLAPIRVRTHEYPGFATDAHPPIMVCLTQADGESVLIESIFDGRLKYTEELVRMGADISLMSPHRARVVGARALQGADIVTPDIRAGLAFMLAAITANGTSRIGNAHLIDRGYARIEERLRAVGVSIEREI
ncbi:UDP-N-acetylglucosamine 1-carboxyvinyltransferase [Patescibacteria group bacterium]|nr:UDP-N-acetylglucosamine 1-carboxyvinyltransferase [Patescibacteria group bacterium]